MSPLDLLDLGLKLFRFFVIIIDTESLRVLRWIIIIAGITLTLMVFCLLCCTPRKHHDSVLFVTNLLISNLLLMCSLIPLVIMTTEIHQWIVFRFAFMISLIFRMCIAVERYMIIAHPTHVRGTPVLTCVVTWFLGFIIFSPLFPVEVMHFFVTSNLLFLIWILIQALIPPTSVLVSVIFVVLTFAALPAASSVATEVKQRTLGILLLLLVDNFLLMVSVLLFFNSFESVHVVFVLLTVFVDLALSVLMFKGSVYKFLARLCYYMMDKSVTTNQQSLENGGVEGHYDTSI